MKSSVEAGLIFLVSCFMIVILIQFASVIANMHQGHQYLDYLLHLTNNYDGDLSLVRQHDANHQICRQCTYQHHKLDDRYEVVVSFPISIPSIYFEQSLTIRGLSHPVE